MRKLNYLLSMFLLLFAGVGTIQAQLPDAYVTKGAGVTDIAAIAASGTKVAVKGSSNNGAKDFMSTNYLSIPSQSNGWSILLHRSTRLIMFLSHMAEPCFGQIYLPMHLTIGLTQIGYLPVTQFWK